MSRAPPPDAPWSVRGPRHPTKAYLSTFGARHGEDPESVRDLIGRTPDEVRQCMGSWLAWPGLLRDLCSMPLSQIAGLCRASVWAATRQVELHHASIAEDLTCATISAGIAGAALEATFPD